MYGTTCKQSIPWKSFRFQKHQSIYFEKFQYFLSSYKHTINHYCLLGQQTKSPKTFRNFTRKDK